MDSEWREAHINSIFLLVMGWAASILFFFGLYFGGLGGALHIHSV